MHAVDGRYGSEADLIGIDRVEDLAADGGVGVFRRAVGRTAGRFVARKVRLPRVALGKSAAAGRVAARVRSLARVRQHMRLEVMAVAERLFAAVKIAL